jgi:hypothetical protein
MTKINLKTDCGHSPKREFLKDFNVAYGKGNAEFLISNVTDDIHWKIIGYKMIEGKEDYAKAIEEMKKEKVSEMTIEKIVTHGKEGAVNGSLKMKDGKKYAFSDFYEFKNTRATNLKTITSYVIEI